MNEGRKDDQEKTRYDLLPPESIELLAQVYTFGARKYDAHNWRKGMAWSRIFGAIMRHMWAFWCGEDNDPESGLPHVIHAMWGCGTLASFMIHHKDKDDRYGKS